MLGLECCIANAAAGLSRGEVDLAEDDEEYQGGSVYVPGKVQIEACHRQMFRKLNGPDRFGWDRQMFDDQIEYV